MTVTNPTAADPIEDQGVGRVRGVPAAIVFGSFVLFTAMPLLRGAWWWTALAALGVLAVAAVLVRSAEAIHVAMFCALGPASSWLMPDWVIWPFPYAVALLLSSGVAWRTPMLRRSLRWARRGQLGRTEWLMIAGATVISSTALVGWFVLLRPDLSDLRGMIPPGTAPWLIALGAVGFSMCNAAVEESIWRGVLLQGLQATGPPTAAVVLQALSFGIAHIHGFPRGAIGIALAAIYGLMIGVIRVRSQGMLAPWIAHVFADLTIVAILATLAF